MISVNSNAPIFILLLSVILTLSNNQVLGHSGRLYNAAAHTAHYFEPNNCVNIDGFTKELRDEIKSYGPVVKKIANQVLSAKKGAAYDELALFTDTIGPRLSGSKSLAAGIDYMLNKFNESSLENVHGEPAMIPRWERGEEWAKIVEPVEKKIDILALGTSVGTRDKVLVAQIVQVKSWNELDELGKAGKLKDKIVLYNVKFTTYEETVGYRSAGARRAGPYGALAALVRSVTPYSIYSAHAGATSYDEENTNSVRIPTAAITLEDADFIDRWTQRNKTVSIQLYMQAKNYPSVQSANVIGDIKGKEKPDNLVVVSGHIDSWDVTNGALDDGGGMMISYMALDALRKLNLRPRRTLRAILWTSEEFGYWGAKQYFANRKNDGTLSKHNVFFESDLGTFAPYGLGIMPNAEPLTKCIVNEVLQLFSEWNMNKLDSKYEGSDIELFSDVGIPSLSLANKNEKYFYYHHTRGDSMTLENPDDLDKCVFIWAASSYVLADLSVDLPKKMSV